MLIRFSWLLVLASFALSCSTGTSVSPDSNAVPGTALSAPLDGIFSAWVELGPSPSGGKTEQIARLIVAVSNCPELEASFEDGQTTSVPMRVRAFEDGNGFPVKSCEAVIPKNAISAQVLGHPLPLLPKEVKRIVVIGDTGCRIKGSAIQACNDPAKWPLAKVIKLVLREIPAARALTGGIIGTPGERIFLNPQLPF
jgi:hypothetical protein